MASGTSRGNVKKTDNKKSDSKQIIEREHIKDTPFTAVKVDNKWYLMMGRYRLTEGKNTLREILKEAKSASWDRLMQIIQIMIDENKPKETTTKTQ